MQQMITARGLAQRFETKTGPVEAVCGIDFDVARGEVVGLLGPNGAGKTTILKILTTLLRPSGGTATVAGADVLVEPREVRRRIGYVAQIGAAPSPGTVVGEEIVVQARLYGLSKAEATARMRELLPRLDLDGFEGRGLGELSGGQRRRFDIALGLVHGPELLFLDEPTTGLDPQSRANMWEHIRSLRADHGTTIVLTTHYLEEADVLADRLLVMDHGRIVADDTSTSLKAKISGDVLKVGLARSPGAGAETAVRAALPIRSYASDGDKLTLTVERGDTAVPLVLKALEGVGEAVVSIDIHRPTLDDVFLALTGHALRDDV